MVLTVPGWIGGGIRVALHEHISEFFAVPQLFLSDTAQTPGELRLLRLGQLDPC
jgi:hypothetical protein